MLWLALAQRAEGGAAANRDTSFLTDLSLEELLNIEVMSVGKKETKLLRSPAAIAVLTGEDIDRLGALSVPEALRAVPGLQVARISANRWAITSRGFNDEYSNKLLVLVDGRSVYTPTFGGVYWNSLDLVLEDMDRIEVIRGPGATLWGANAVNGVINIITKSAKDTQGGLLSTTVGTEPRPSVSARYGGQLASNVYYRVYTKYFCRDGFEDAQGRSMNDGWDVARGGFRVDWEASEQNMLTFSGDYFDGTYGEQVGKIAAATADYRVFGLDLPMSGGNILGRWNSRFSDESELTVQIYYDYYDRKNAFGGGVLMPELNEFAPGENMLSERRHTWDLDVHHRFGLGERNDIVWGVGYRRTEDEMDSGGTEIFWSSETSHDNLFSAFVQDEITLLEDRLWLTLGSKFEHQDYTGFEIQPGARLQWAPTERQNVWASVARAVRTPTRLERDARVDLGAVPPMPPTMLPVLVSAFGNPNADSEELLATEVGYRIEPTRRLSFDLAGFYNEYDLLTAVGPQASLEPDPMAPMYVLQSYRYMNTVSGHTYGAEALANWQATDQWRWTVGYTWLKADFGENLAQTQSHPEHQFHVRSSLDLGRGWQVNAAAYYVDEVKSLPQGVQVPVSIDSYVRLDLGLNWRPNEYLEFSVWAQNLLDDGHPEFASYKTPNIAEVPRTFYGTVTVRF